MTGGEKARFCSHCDLSVNNISALTRKQTLRLVHESNGRICVRYIKNPVTNAPVFADRLYRITRRAKVAAGILGATLAVSTLAYAQGSGPVSFTQKAEAVPTENADKNKTEGGTASLSGTVSDAAGAVVPNATVVLLMPETAFRQAGTTDENGSYKFENISAGKYRLETASPGFKVSVREIEVSDGKENAADVELEVSDVTITMGAMVMIDYRTPLFRAVSDGKLEEVRSLLVRGESVNAKDENYNGITPIFVAIENGSTEIAELLLNFGAKINVRDENRQTPLMRLDEDASVELVELLIKHGARVNVVDKEANTPLIFAAGTVKPEVLQILIRHGKNVDARNSEGRTALMAAAEADNLENVRLLLAAGADANLKDTDGETAFSLTSDEEIETLLIEFGAEVSDNSQ